MKVKSTTSSDNEPTTNGIGVISSSQLKDRLKETESSLSVISKVCTNSVRGKQAKIAVWNTKHSCL